MGVAIRRASAGLKARARWAWEGFRHVLRAEGSLRQWLGANLASAPLALVLPLSPGQRAAILMGGVMVLAMECMNTSIERVVDDVSEVRRPRAKQAKDAGSAAVALAAVGVGVAWASALLRLLL